MSSVKLSAVLSAAILQKDQIVLPSDKSNCWVFSDSSAFKAAAQFYESGQSIEFSFHLNPAERLESSGMRELMALQKMCQHSLKVSLFKGTNVLWGTDSSNVVV